MLSFGPDAKHHECLHGILYLKILRTARSNQEHIHHSVHVSLLSRTVLLKMFCIIYNQIPRECDFTPQCDLYKILLLPTDKWTLVLADIHVPELLLWILFLCISLAVCLSKMNASDFFGISYANRQRIHK